MQNKETPLEISDTIILKSDSYIKNTISDAKRRVIQNLQEQREAHKNINLMNIINEYPESVRSYLVRYVQHIECSDGCTGRCGWCAFPVNRNIKEGFSYESLKQFGEKYGDQLPETISFYWASDPLDIAGKKECGQPYNYVDIVTETIKHLRPGQRIYTSTVIPTGTYEVARDLLIFLHKHWVENKHYTALHTVRFSSTDKNNELIPKLRKELEEQYNLHPVFLNAQFGAMEQREKDSGKIKKIGKIINHPDRNIRSHPDIDTIACNDGVLIKTDGFYSIAMEAVTKKNPYGQITEKLDPKAETLAIPVYTEISRFRSEQTKQQILSGVNPGLIPNIVFQIIESKTGKILEKKEMPTLRRDLLAYSFLGSAMYSLIEEGLGKKQKAILSNLEKETDNRWSQTQRLILESDDEEAKEVTEDWYLGVKDVFHKLKLSSLDIKKID